MIYLLITTSLIERNFEERKRRYLNGITTAIRRFQELTVPYKIIILENNGRRPTFLDEFGIDVFYTNNNRLQTPNIGNKELADLHECIRQYQIQEDDFIIKLSGRYIIQEQSEFMDALIKHRDTKAAIVQYGSFNAIQYERIRDCVTGLIGMQCRYMKQIQFAQPFGCIEWNWADVVLSIPEEAVHRLHSLGLAICPGPDSYRLI